MPKATRELGERMGRASDSSFSAQAQSLQNVVRRVGVILGALHQLVMTRVCEDCDVELAEELNDQLKPLIDALIHFEVPR